GEEAVAAVNACSPDVRAKLVEFHTSGELAKIARPRELLAIIGKPDHGDDVAKWAMAHASELADADCFEAVRIDPLTYSLNLRKLEEVASTFRDSRKRQQEWIAERSSARTKLVVCVMAVAAIGGLVYWRVRR